MPYDPASAERSVQVLAYTVQFSVDKSYAKPGDKLRFTVVVTTDGGPAAYVPVQIRLRLGAFEGTLLEGATDFNGVWVEDWAVPYRAFTPEGVVGLPCNKAELYARLGVSPYTPSNRVAVTFAYPTRLTLTTDKAAYAPGEAVTARAKLELADEFEGWVPLPNQTVVFTLDGQAKSARTGPDGVATATLTAPTAPGTYTLKATFAGAGSAAAAGLAILGRGGIVGAALDVAAPILAALGLMAACTKLGR